MIELNNQTKSKIDLILVKKISNFFFGYFRVSEKEVVIVFVGDQRIKSLNKKYLHHNYVTDVMAFPGEGESLGEIIIDYAQIKRQAKEYNNTTRDELLTVVVHGLLHLIGYTDETKAKRERMLKAGERIIEEFRRKKK